MESQRAAGLQFILGSKEVGSAQECLSIRIDELARENEGKQAKRENFLLPCPFMWVAPEDVVQVWGGASHCKGSSQENPSQVSLAAWALVDSRWSNWQPRLAITGTWDAIIKTQCLQGQDEGFTTLSPQRSGIGARAQSFAS